MSVKAGESFERAIAYIMAAAGFIIKEQPHPVRLSGTIVGDVDVLAIDPRSKTPIAVSCKEWRDQAPQSKDFNHFISMMEIENIQHGIIAWTNVPSSIIPLIKNAERKKYNIIIVDSVRYEELHAMMLEGQQDKIEDFFRSHLQLSSSKVNTLGDEMELRTRRKSEGTVQCENLLPINHHIEPPRYVRNAYFKHSEATLHIRPYLFAIFHAFKQARMRGELLAEINTDITMICDAVTGQYLEDEDPVYDLITSHYTDAVKRTQIEEEDFTVERDEPQINRQEITYRMRVDSSKAIEPEEYSWTDSKENAHKGTLELSPKDLKEIRSFILEVPYWSVTFEIGKYRYQRDYYATTGKVIQDSMTKCLICNRRTMAICTKCGSTICDTHSLTCKTCSQIFCISDQRQCADCGSSFCLKHAKGNPCVTCQKFVCATDDVRCATCQETICNDHQIKCTQCEKSTCGSHDVAARYMGLKKHFCSEKCHSQYDLSYKSTGKLGKLKKTLGQK